jgi:hypothetical protein
MTPLGIINLLSAIYLSGAISLAVSLNENRAPRLILRETLRRWRKFLLWGLILGALITLISTVFE